MRLPIVAALMISTASAAHATPVTYDITTTTAYFGQVSGFLTGEGTTLEAWQIVATSGSSSWIFDSTISGQSGGGTVLPYTLQDGTPVTNYTFFDNSLGQFILIVSGDFTSGLVYAGGQGMFQGSQNIGVFANATILNFFLDPQLSDDVLLSPAAVPEPGSFTLLAVGLIAAGLLKAKKLTLTGFRKLSQFA